MPLRERSDERCPCCGGYEGEHAGCVFFSLRAERDRAVEIRENANTVSSRLDWEVGELKRENTRLRGELHDAEAAHLSMVRKAGELRDERDRLREALDAIGSLGGPLHMLEPDQGNGPPNYEWAATELRRILSTVNEGDAA